MLKLILLWSLILLSKIIAITPLSVRTINANGDNHKVQHPFGMSSTIRMPESFTTSFHTLERLIYEISVKYKHIHRITYLTCLDENQQSHLHKEFANDMKKADMKSKSDAEFNLKLMTKIESEFETKTPIEIEVETQLKEFRNEQNHCLSTAKCNEFKRKQTKSMTNIGTAIVLRNLFEQFIETKSDDDNGIDKVDNDSYNDNDYDNDNDKDDNKNDGDANDGNDDDNNKNYTKILNNTITDDNIDFDSNGHDHKSFKGLLIKIGLIEVFADNRTMAKANRTINGQHLFARFLASETFRQFVVLNLACGNRSLAILRMASDIGLFNSSYHWLLIGDYPLMSSSEYNMQNDDDFNGTMNSSKLLFQTLQTIDININTELIFAKRISRRHSYGNHFNKQMEEFYLLYDIWNPSYHLGGKLNITKIGTFSGMNGLNLYNWYKSSTTIVRRMDMKNISISCMIVVTNNVKGERLEDYLTQQHNPHLDSMHRFSYALHSHIGELFNFRLYLIRTSSWGYLRNGTFDGMVGAVARRQVDIGGSPVFCRLDRFKVIDYTSQSWVARPCFMFRHPKGAFTDRIYFLQPFSNSVWICVGVSCILISIAVWISNYADEEILSKNNDKKLMYPNEIINNFMKNRKLIKPASLAVRQPNESTKLRDKLFRLICLKSLAIKHHNLPIVKRYNVFDTVLFAIGNLCQQGLTFPVKCFSGRCVTLSSLLFAFCISQFYSANIVGSLLMEKPKTIKTLADLINSSLEIILEDIIYNRDYFLSTTDPEGIELYIKKVSQKSKIDEIIGPGYLMRDLNMTERSYINTNKSLAWKTPTDGLRYVQNGGYAFHVDVATAYKIITDSFTEKEICDLSEIQLFPPKKMVNIVQKGSPFRKILTYGLRRTMESGIMDYQRKIWHQAKPQCIKKIHTEDLKFDMNSFTSAALVLISGFAASIIILLFENIYYQISRE